MRKWTILMAGMMTLAAVGGQTLKPEAMVSDLYAAIKLSNDFPDTFGEWKEEKNTIAVITSPDQEAVINQIYQETLSRTYVNKRQEAVMLSVAYSHKQSDQSGVHYPEVCYPAQGFTVSKRRDDSIEIENRVINVSRMTAKAPGRTEQISYFILVGSIPVGGGNKVKLAQMQYSLRGYIADGVLIRVSNISSEPEASWKKHDLFLKEMIPSLKGGLSERVDAALRHELTPKHKS